MTKFDDAFDQPSPEERLQNEAEELMRQGRFVDAAERYHDLRGFSPTDLWVNLGHASALECAGRVGEAQQILDEADHQHRSNRHLQRFRHMFFERREDLLGARACIQLLQSEDGFNEGPTDQLADLFFNQGRYTEALNELRRILRDEPHDDATLRASLLGRLGACLRQTGSLEEAREHLLASLGIEPGNHWTLAELAETERAAGNADAARRYYEQALAANPDDNWCRGHLAQLEHEQGASERAIALYDQILKAEPKAAWAHVELGQVLTTSDPARSKACCEAALDIDPAYPWGWAHLGVLARHEGDHETARGHLKTALSHSPQSVWILHELADTCQQMGRLEEALTHLEHAENLAPFDAGTFGYRANILRSADRGEEARANLRKAVELDRDYVWAWRELAELEALRGDIDTAKDCHREATEIEPGVAINDGLMAFILRCSDQADLAEPYLREAIRAQPDYLWAWRELIEYQLVRGKSEQALADAEQALKELPTSPQILALKAESLRQMGRRPEALEMVERALQIDERPPQLWALRAELTADRDPTKALELIDHAIRLGSQDDFRVLRAQLLARCERTQEAQAELEQLIAGDDAPVSAWLLAADMIEQSGDAERARQLAHQALEQFPADPRLLLVATRLDLDAGTNNAIDRLEQCFSVRQGVAWREAAVLYARGGDAFGARRACQLLRDEASSSDELAEAWMAAAEIELMFGENSVARQATSQSLAAKDDHLGALLLHAMLCEREGRRDEAVDRLQQLAGHLDKNTELSDTARSHHWRQAAQLHEHQGNADEAERAWDACLILDGADHIGIHRERAAARLRRGDVDNAIDELDEILGFHDLPAEQRISVIVELAQAHIQADDHAGACTLLMDQEEMNNDGRLLLAQLSIAGDQHDTAITLLDSIDDETDELRLRLIERLRIQCLQAKGEHDDAISLAQALWDSHPQDEDSAVLLVELSMLRGAIDEALTVVSDRRLPDTASIPRALLWTCLLLERHDSQVALTRLGPHRRLLDADVPLVRVLRTAWPWWQGPAESVSQADVLALPPLPRMALALADDLAAQGRQDLALPLLGAQEEALGARGLVASQRELLRRMVPLATNLGQRRLAWKLAWRSRSLLTLLRCLV